MWIQSLLLLQVLAGIRASKEEMDLIRHLFFNYSPVARPARSAGDTVELKFGFTISQIIDLDEKRQILTTTIWIRQVWTNHFLKWNPEKYGGLKMIVVPPESVWRPDIVLYNNVNNDNRRSEIGSDSASVHLFYNGTNLWLSPKILKSKCNVDVTYFPFDEQRCILQFGSWTYNALKVNLTQEDNGADTKKFTENSEWALVDVPVKWTMEYFKCCPEPYVYLTYTVVMKRRSLYFVINLILPILLVAVLSVITFIIPVESGERMSMAIALLLSMFVFMRVVEDIIPETSDVVPMVSYFFTITLIEMTVVVIVNCFIFRAHFPPHNPVPFWLQRLLSKYSSNVHRGTPERTEEPTSPLKRVNCTCTCGHNRVVYVGNQMTQSGVRTSVHFAEDGRCREADSEIVFNGRDRGCSPMDEYPLISSDVRDGHRKTLLRACNSPKGVGDIAYQSSLMHNINAALTKLTAIEEEKAMAHRWKCFARLLDRFFIWFSGLVILVSIGTLLVHAWPRYTF